jgi:hypothetical protein
MSKQPTPPTSQAYIVLFSQNAPPWMALLEEEWVRQGNQLSTLQGTAGAPPAPVAVPTPTAVPVASTDTTLLRWLGDTVSAAPSTETASTAPTPTFPLDAGRDDGVHEEAEETQGRTEDENRSEAGHTASLPEHEILGEAPATPEKGTRNDDPDIQGAFGF